jgi:hypothetical protein
MGAAARWNRQAAAFRLQGCSPTCHLAVATFSLLVQLPFTQPAYKGPRQPPLIRAVPVTERQRRGSVLRGAYEVQRQTSHIAPDFARYATPVDHKAGLTSALSVRPTAE